MKTPALLLLLTGLLANGQESRWENAYDQPLDFNCPAGQTISSIKSQHDNSKEDRIWEFTCTDTFDPSAECSMSPYANDFDQTFTYECPPNHIMAGMSSYHDSGKEDRRWQFYCCRSNGYCTANCEWTTYVNYFDEPFHWVVPNPNYLVGAESYHDNGKEDRRWMYKYCSKVQC
ncbi:dermatopontin-like [Garra rufa]|uniref:dermatopontin-like n=1 Tax=Garra rufa TaxID=137080 RepID=UPI003CCE7BF7